MYCNTHDYNITFTSTQYVMLGLLKINIAEFRLLARIDIFMFHLYALLRLYDRPK